MIYRGLKKYHVTRWWKVDKERLPNFPPLTNVLKRVFFDGAYIEKWGMVFWGESNKEENVVFFLFFLLINFF